MKPPFGTLNGTIAKAIAQNMPKGIKRISEPFAAGGTFALMLEKRRPKEHLVNIADEELFKAFEFVKSAPSREFRALKKFDWIGSPETFDQVMGISADSGPEFMYRWFYVKKFGMRMGTDPEAPPEFDILSTGADAWPHLLGLPIMRVALKVATLTNEDPLSAMGGGADTFTILLPKAPEHVAAVRSRLSGMDGPTFFATKVLAAEALMDDAKTYGDRKVSPLQAASIMMATMSVVTNYDNALPALEFDAMEQMK